MKFGIINIAGIIIIIIMLIPNILYAVHHHNSENKPTNKTMNLLEQAGRYACILLMFFPLGVWKFGFSSVAGMLIYLFGNGILLLAYLLVWILYFKKQSGEKAMALAILPTCIFLVSGITLHHWLLLAAAVIFGTGHISNTYRQYEQCQMIKTMDK